MKRRTKSRLLATLLALALVVGMLPVSALAAWVDDVPLAAVPTGEEAQTAMPGKTPAQGADLTAAADEAAGEDLPGYTMVTAEANALPVGEDHQYLIVAWVSDVPYAFYPNGAGMGTKCGDTFAKTCNSNLTAKLTVSDGALTATNYAGDEAIELSDLHFTLSDKGSNTYGISGGGYNLTLNTTVGAGMGVAAPTAGSAFTATKRDNGSYQFKTGDRSLEFVKAANTTSHCDNFWGATSAYVGITNSVGILTGGLYLYEKNAEGVDPDPGETIEHHTPTQGMNQHYLQYNGSGAWIGGDTANANIRLDAYDATYTQYTAADVPSGTYAIYSSRSTQPKWMHVTDDSINRCTNQENIDAHRFIFAYDAQARGYTIQSKATSKYLHAERGALSMSTESTIFYIDKVDNTNFYHIWWESAVRSGEAISEMFNAASDNTWVFTGGVDMDGNWAQTGGQRNLMGHFEEYVRWTYAQSGSADSTTKERYTVNTSRAGLTLADIVGSWDQYVAQYNPKAAVYMVGGEDAADANFSDHLNTFINSAIALRNGSGFAVIIKSYDSALAEKNAAVDAAVAALKSDTAKFDRVVVVNTSLTDAQLTGGHPNAAGHLELSKQLVMATCANGSTGGNYPGGIGIKNFQKLDAPATYDTDKTPAVSVTDGTMTIALTGVDSFRYELRLANGVTLSGTGVNGSATVTDVPGDVNYTLVTRSADGATQYKTVTKETAALSELQQAIVNKVNDKSTPLTWLFMGDSITHACHHLGGYDSVAQLTEDYLGILGRDQDVVINTAVSSATTTSTLNRIQYRLNQFPAPDVASIMLGTNDCGGSLDVATYRANLNAIIDAIKAKNENVIIILRSPTGSWTSHVLPPYCEAMQAVAAERNCIYIDQYTETQGMLNTYSNWIRNNSSASFAFQVYYGNNLHPGAKAQLDMAKMLFKGIGLWNEDMPIANLDYALTTAETGDASVASALQRGEGTLTLNISALGGGLGETTFTATKDGQSWSVTAPAGTDPVLALPDGTYTVTASGVKTSEAKTVTFAAAVVEMGEDAPPIETSGYPQRDPSKVQNYLDFSSNGWGSAASPAALELYGVSGTTFTKDTDGIDSGVYGIYDPDSGANRWMHVSGDVTNQCGSNPADHATDHSFTFTYNAEKKAYTIRSVKTGKYVTQTRSNGQLAVNDTPTWFYVSPVDPENNNGTYYIWWETDPQLGGAIGEMFNAQPGNTWVFTGGADVAGQFEQTRGRRSFAGQFEEYVRWHFNLAMGAGENSVGGFSPTRQRYVINTAYAGQTLQEIVTDAGWQERVTDFSPRAVTYMVGREDLANAASFETDLAAFIDKATALRDNNGFAVIMKSYDSSLAELNAKVDSVVAGYQTTAAGKYSHIVVVDALTLTNDQKTADDHPNADGHMELGRKLAVAVGGNGNNFPGNAQNRYTEAAMPTFNKAVTPTVAFADGVMTVSGLPGEFTYQVKLADGVTVSGTGTNTAAIAGLPNGAAYSLVTRNAAGTTQYKTVTGLVGGGDLPAKTGEQKKIADLLAAHPDDSLTWLFVGDSITHGILVSGYDSAAQLMEEYLDTIGRKKDIVVNAGVSSATTDSTLNAKAYRLDPFTADVAVIMLGTNDCSANLTGEQVISTTKYKENLGKIVDAIRANNEDAIIVLRTPTGYRDSLHPQMSQYVAQMTAFAQENGLILVDQMTATQHAIDTYSWCMSGAEYYGDALHPGVIGQLKIFQMLLRAMGLWDEDNEICNLDYLWTGMTAETSATAVGNALRANGSKLTLSASALDGNLGRVTLTATKDGQSWSVLAEAGETPALTLPDGTYTVTAAGLMKNTAKTVTYAGGEVTIDADAEPTKLPAPEEPKVYEYVLDTDGVTEGVYSIVPATGRVVGMHDSGDTTNQCGTTVTDNKVNIIHDEHKWTFVPGTDGKFTIRSNGGKYLTSTANGAQLALSATQELFTVTHTANGEYTVRNEAGQYLAFPDSGSVKWCFQAAEAKVRLFRETAAALEDMAQTQFKGTNATMPMDPEATQSTFRIPALVTLPNGWIVAASDVRWPNTADSPNNLDTIVSVSKDGGETWDWEMVNYFSDFAPIKNSGTKSDSASFIDPALAVDGSGKLWMAVDLQPTHVNLGQAGQKTGSGFDPDGLLMVAPISEAEWNEKVGTSLGRDEATRLQYQAYYEYRVDINGTPDGTVEKNGENVSLFSIFHKDDENRTATGYYVDAFFDLWYDYGEADGGLKPVLVAQKESTKVTQANLFYKQSPWKAYSTTYLMIRTAEVAGDGLVWSEPKLISGVKNMNGETFLAFCPGRGTVITLGDGTERIIFPVYDNVGGEHTSVVYTDDGGVTWHRSGRVENGNAGKTSESQVVELPGTNGDGTPLLRIYSRNTAGRISYADSSDGGATWTASQTDDALKYGNNVMVSFINLEGVVRAPDGTVYEHLILASYPWGTINSGEHSRSNGVVRIGTIGTGTGHPVTWLNENTARTEYLGRFNYSCLTQLLDREGKGTDGFALLYEKDSSTGMDQIFDVLTTADLLGTGWDWALTEEDLPAFEPTEPTLPDGAVWAYVAFTDGTPSATNGWGTSAEPYGITLYQESATSTGGAKVTDMANGVYRLWSGSRWMHVDDTANKDKTNQCDANGGSHDAHKFRFTRTADGFYTIQSVASTSQERYLNIGETGSYAQLPCTETPTKFAVEKAEGQDGVYYLKAAVYPPFAFKNPVTTGINQTLTYQQVTALDAVKGDGTMYVVIAPNVNGGTRAMWATDERTDNYTATLNGDETRVTLGGDANRQLWGFQPAEGGYKVISRQHRKYLTTTASGSHLALNDEGSVFTVEAGAAAGTFYLKSGAQYLSWNGGWQMANAPFAMKLYTPVLETVDLTGREEAQTVFRGTTAGTEHPDQPYAPGTGDSQQFRIPALITLSNGWLVAAADVRWSHGRDNPSNLETSVAVSKDNGATWEWEFVNYFGDYANTVSDSLSTAFIDPALIQDPATGKVWMLVDVTSADGKGTSGSTGFDSQDRLLVAHVPAYVNQKAPGNAGLYTYYMSKVGTDYTVNGETVTLYPIESSTGATDCDGVYVDAFYNIYHVNGTAVEREMVAQHGSDKIVQDNLFYRQSEWRVFPTCFLMLRSAEVNETTGKLEWSDPILTNLRGTTPGAGAAFFGAGPGRGFVADSGRILFPVYDNVGGEHASVIYSDDNGATWQRGGRALNTVGQKTSESQIVRLPDGSLRMYSRNRGRYVGYSDSTDGGLTWSETKLDEGLAYCGNCMVSVINVEGKLTDPEGNVYENLIMASYPEGNGNYNPGEAWSYRDTGAVRFGSISTEEGHPVTWLGELKQLLGTAGFVYSCLTQIQEDGKATDRFGWLYEPWNVINYVTYKELTVAEVLGEGWTLTVETPDEPEPTTYTVTFAGEGVSQSPVIVEAGATVDLPTPTREGYTFDGWFNGETRFTESTPVHSNLTLTARWTEIPVERGDLSGAVLTVSPATVTGGGTVTVTVTGIPADVTGVTLTQDGEDVALTRDENGVYTGSAIAPQGTGLRTLVFLLSAEGCDTRRIDVTVTLTESGTGGSTGGSTGGGGTRPVTPPEENLDDPDVPLADRPQLFEDVKGDDWFYDAAKFVAEKGLMRGVSETSFQPAMNTTRGMIVTILYRMENEPEVAPTTFLDVAHSSWYGSAAAWGEQTGIAKGMSDGNFRAMDDVTREQLAAFLFRYAEHRGFDVTARGDLTAFSDGAKVSSWAEDAMSWAVAIGLIKGKGAAGLDPTSTATRAEVATILMRLCQTLEVEGE